MIEITGYGPGTSSFSGKEGDELVSCQMDGQEHQLTFSELKKFIQMKCRKPAAPRPTPLLDRVNNH